MLEDEDVLSDAIKKAEKKKGRNLKLKRNVQYKAQFGEFKD